MVPFSMRVSTRMRSCSGPSPPVCPAFSGSDELRTKSFSSGGIASLRLPRGDACASRTGPARSAADAKSQLCRPFASTTRSITGSVSTSWRMITSRLRSGVKRTSALSRLILATGATCMPGGPDNVTSSSVTPRRGKSRSEVDPWSSKVRPVRAFTWAIIWSRTISAGAAIVMNVATAAVMLPRTSTA